jgi:hypothetical protein
MILPIQLTYMNFIWKSTAQELFGRCVVLSPLYAREPLLGNLEVTWVPLITPTQSCNRVQARVAHITIWKSSRATFDHWGSASRWSLDHLSTDLSNNIRDIFLVDLIHMMWTTRNIRLCLRTLRDIATCSSTQVLMISFSNPQTRNVFTRWLKGVLFILDMLIASTLLL